MSSTFATLSPTPTPTPLSSTTSTPRSPVLYLKLHEDQAIAANLARKKVTPLQTAMKLAIKLNKNFAEGAHSDELMGLT
ncbi:hypothetical protein TorRG33x02_138400 [Trema orientale]|uniref:Uncharacterized protein n=1 Tax=Trema orientale TaxID=63057 RepID=A0A2P5EXV4_TREOI|nr:hypothetical protein TorRG33x02_138400 [Trema orientale]